MSSNIAYTKHIEASTRHLKDIIELQTVLTSATFDLESFMDVLVQRVEILTSATGAVIELLEDDELVYRAASGDAAQYVGFRLKAASSISGLCVHTGEIAISQDTSTDSRVDADACKKVNAASLIVVPLSRKNEIVGVLKVMSNKPFAFKESDIQTLQILAGLLGGALGQQLEIDRRKQLEERLMHMAQYDTLTGLPNRALFDDRLFHALERSKREARNLALFYIDIDLFKTINDSFGHLEGDSILQQFSARISAIIRTSDTFARLGGDEFVLIVEDLNNFQEPVTIATKIINCLNPKFNINNELITITASIGIAVNADRTIGPRELIHEADIQLYEAKRLGRNCFQFGRRT